MRRVSGGESKARRWPEPPGQVKRGATAIDPGFHRGKGDAYHQYWCVFDIDEHPYVDQALQLAVSSRISIAITNQCMWCLVDQIRGSLHPGWRR